MDEEVPPQVEQVFEGAQGYQDTQIFPQGVEVPVGGQGKNVS